MLTNIIFSLIIGSVLIRLNKDHIHSNLELLLYSLGTGPIFTVMLLYYLLLFLPHRSSLFYFLFIVIVYSGLLFIGRKSLLLLFSDLWNSAKISIKKISVSNTSKKIELISLALFCILLLILFLIPYLSNTLQLPLE